MSDTTGSSSFPDRLWRFALRVVLWMVVLCVLPTLVCVWLGSRQAVRREVALCQRLEAAVGEAPDQAVEASPANATADRVMELAADLGVRLNPEGASSEGPDLLFELDLYVDRQLDHPDQDLEPPADHLAQYLADSSDTLDALGEAVIGQEPARWGRVERLFDRLLLDSEGYLQLHSVLAAEALAASVAGEAGRVERAVRTSWILNAATTSTIDAVAMRNALAVTRVQAQVMRRVELDPELWVGDLAGIDLAAAVRRGFLLHSWVWVSAVRTGRVWDEVDEGGPGPLAEPLVRPLLRLSIVERSELMVGALVELDGRDPLTIDSDGFDSRWLARMSGWNLLGPMAWTGPLPIYSEAATAALDVELTRLGLELRERTAVEGGLPPELPPRDCDAVPDRRWLFEVDQDGRVRIRLDPPAADLNPS